jgi:hypothetical protein
MACNITVTILDIIHRPVFFYLKLTQLYWFVLPRKKHITSPLRAQQVNTIYCIGLSRCHVNISITILGIIHCPAFCLKHGFGHWLPSPFPGETY